MSSKFRVALLVTALLAQAPEAWAAKSPGVRLKRVNQSLESIAGRDRSARSLQGTVELSVGSLYVFTGLGMIYGVGKYLNQPNLAPSKFFNVELGNAFIDAYSRIPGAILGVAVGGALTVTGFNMASEGYGFLFRGQMTKADAFFHGTWQTTVQKSDADVLKKAELGEKMLKELYEEGRQTRLKSAWTNLICGGLILIAATSHPEEPLPFFLGGGAGVYGLVSLLDNSLAEEEYLDYEAWRTDTPREVRMRGTGLKLAAVPGPQSMALGFSYGF